MYYSKSRDRDSRAPLGSTLRNLGEEASDGARIECYRQRTGPNAAPHRYVELTYRSSSNKKGWIARPGTQPSPNA